MWLDPSFMIVQLKNTADVPLPIIYPGLLKIRAGTQVKFVSLFFGGSKSESPSLIYITCWLVLCNMNFMNVGGLGISSSQLTNSYFSEG